MDPLLPLAPQLDRQISLLCNSTTRLSLMSVVIPSLPQHATVASVLAATTPADLIGMMQDGSIGVFALRAPGPDGGAGVDERFLPSLQATLRNSFSPSLIAGVKIWYRSVHRWASEIADPDDLVDALFAASSRVVGLGPVAVPTSFSRHPMQRQARASGMELWQ